MAKIRKIATKPLRVDLMHNATDFKVASLASLGFTTEMISAQTGLTFCQVTYRLTKSGIKRAAYRSGESEVAKAVLAQNLKTAKPLVMESLQAHLAELYSER